MAIIKDLFKAFKEGELPKDGGYIITSSLDGDTGYRKYETTSYDNVKDIYLNENELVFQADGQKIFLAYEPVHYSKKHVEPTYREEKHRLPYRNSEIEIYTSKRQDRILIGKKPIMTYTSFTILAPTTYIKSYIIFKTEDFLDALENFFVISLWKEARISKSEAQKAAKFIRQLFETLY